jgi:hypothetical protein
MAEARQGPHVIIIGAGMNSDRNINNGLTADIVLQVLQA